MSAARNDLLHLDLDSFGALLSTSNRGAIPQAGERCNTLSGFYALRESFHEHHFSFSNPILRLFLTSVLHFLELLAPCGFQEA